MFLTLSPISVKKNLKKNFFLFFKSTLTLNVIVLDGFGLEVSVKAVGEWPSLT